MGFGSAARDSVSCYPTAEHNAVYPRTPILFRYARKIVAIGQCMYLSLPGEVAARITMHSARVCIGIARRAVPCRAVDYNINEFRPLTFGRLAAGRGQTTLLFYGYYAE